MPEARLRRSRCLVAFWENGTFVLENYLSGRQTVTAPLVAHLLQELDGYTPPDVLRQRFGAIPDADTLIERLTTRDVLISEGSPLDRKETLLEAEWAWGGEARRFHYRTQNVPYEPNMEAQRESLVRLARTEPPPSPFREYGTAGLPLPGSFDEPAGELWDTLRSRRTRRRFDREPVSLNELGTVLLWTWGKTHQVQSGEIGPYLLKTSPSGGARHSIEVYPVVLRVDGVEPGIYHYSVAQHALELLRPGWFEESVVRFFAHQPWVRDAAVVFLMTAVLERSMWKYRHSHAYRVLLLDAGHLGQTFHLVCTRLGLAPFTSSGLGDAAIEDALALNGVTEIPLYAAAAGRPATGE